MSKSYCVQSRKINSAIFLLLRNQPFFHKSLSNNKICFFKLISGKSPYWTSNYCDLPSLKVSSNKMQCLSLYFVEMNPKMSTSSLTSEFLGKTKATHLLTFSIVMHKSIILGKTFLIRLLYQGVVLLLVVYSSPWRRT